MIFFESDWRINMEPNKIAMQVKKWYQPHHTLIVGMDGLGGAGKSTLSESLYQLLSEEHYNIVVLHIDDFIHPRAIRYEQGYAAWECYYYRQWRYDYLIEEIIKPIRLDNPLRKEIELYDKEHDIYRLHRIDIPVGSIVIIEGVFLQREELKGVFDDMIYIDVPEEIRWNRVLARDGYIGDSHQIQEKYEHRYFPAEHYYLKNCAPKENADYVIEV